MSRDWKKAFSGKEESSETVAEKSQNAEPQVQEETVKVSDVSALVDKLLAEKLQAANLPKQETQSKEFLQVRNENFDEIPELRGFTAGVERKYVLVDGTKPISRNLLTRHKEGSPLQYINPETKEVHALFFSLTETSFFKDKHKGIAKVEHVHFKDGILTTYGSDIKLQKFLAIHPGNKAMGGHLFEEYNPSKEAEVEIDTFEVENEARNLAVQLSALKQDAVARLLCIDYKEDWEPAELKKAIYIQAKKQPKNFVKLANDPTLELKGTAKTSVHRGLLTYKNYKFYNKAGDVICTVAPNQSEWDAVADYFLSGEGRTTYEYLKNAIG